MLSDQSKLVSGWRTKAKCDQSSGGKRLPLGQGSRAAGLVSVTIDEVAFLVKVIVKRGMDRDEFLQRLHASKSQRRPLSSAERKMRIFNAIVEPPPHLAPAQIAEYLRWSGQSGQDAKLPAT